MAGQGVVSAETRTRWGAAARRMLALSYLLVCQFASLPVSGQESAPTSQSPPHDSGPVMLASFGFGGAVPTERWAPITVYVTTGYRAVAGTIVVEFPQDETQTARISVPFAATPNRTTQVPVVAALPNSCDRVSFTMVDDRARVVRSLAYTRVGTERTAQLPPLLEPGRGLLVCVGRSSLPESVRAWTANVDETQLVRRSVQGSKRADLEWSWSRATPGQIGPEELPTAWMAYDGVTALVVNP